MAAIPVAPDTGTPPKTRGGFGRAKVRYIMTPDFDDPLPEFAEYT